jgi:Kelch motif
MDDLRDRFATLDRVPVPDVWSEVERRREVRRKAPPPARLVAVEPAAPRSVTRPAPAAARLRRDRRALWLLVAAALATVALLPLVFSVGSRPDQRPTIAPSPVLSPPPSSPASSIAVPTTDSWIVTGNLQVRRVEGRAATLLADGRVLVAGGNGDINEKDPAFTDTEIYAPDRGAWIKTGQMIFARYSGHSMTLLPDGKVLVAGGSAYQRAGSGPYPRGDAELYDPTTGTWAETGAMALARSHHSAVLLRDRRVLVVGGYGNSLRPTDVGEIYDPATGTWARTAPTRALRWPFAAVSLGDGRVLVVGSMDEGRTQLSAVVYDPATDKWSRTANPVAPDCLFARLVALANGSVLAMCGTVYDTDKPFAEMYDPGQDRWAATSNPPRRLTGPAVLLADGRVLVSDAKAGALYDPISATWLSAALPDPQTVPGQYNPDTTTLLADGRVLLTMGPTAFLYTPAEP